MDLITLRRSNFISTCGAGSIVDFRSDKSSISVLVLLFDNWQSSRKIFEPRLAKLLNVADFREPPPLVDKEDIFSSDAIRVIQFPRWLQCPKCRRIKDLDEWGENTLDSYDKYCTYCSKDKTKSKRVYCVPIRFLAACENGHIDDFPWDRFVGHKKNCERSDLKLIDRGSGIDKVFVKCESCKSQRSLKDAFNKSGFINPPISCTCKSPWIQIDKFNREKKCDKPFRAFQRGSSSLYYPNTKSAISIPPWSSIKNDQLAQLLPQIIKSDDEHIPMLIKIFAESDPAIKSMIKNGSSIEEISDIFISYKNSDGDEEKLAMQEYLVLKNSCLEDAEDYDFIADKKEVPSQFKKFIKGIAKIKRLREVRALCSFSRVNSSESPSAKQNVVPNNQEWLPAVENYGEGIFINFFNEYLIEWESRKEVIDRVNEANRLFKNAYLSDGGEYSEIKNKLSPRYFLLHSISHLLIRGLSSYCGYSLSSIKEKIYSNNSKFNEGIQQAGILIYTASSDADGTLGGLAGMAEKDKIHSLISSSLNDAKWCSGDPLCINRSNDISLTGSLASCHNCTLLPETSCESFNRFLDRGLLFGTELNSDLGFFKDI
tara:strand:- start:70 stop:1866 length:1797 start_codon:yes stop_codon:yes gene_type:complete